MDINKLSVAIGSSGSGVCISIPYGLKSINNTCITNNITSTEDYIVSKSRCEYCKSKIIPNKINCSNCGANY